MSAPIAKTTVPVQDMTDREIAEETLEWLRSFGMALKTLQSGGMGGMVKAMMSKGK